MTPPLQIRLRAEFRAGEILKAMAENGERDTGGKGRIESRPATQLKDLGVTKSESSRWQQRAAMPADKQEAMIARAKQAAASAVDATPEAKQERRAAREAELGAKQRRRFSAGRGRV